MALAVRLPKLIVLPHAKAQRANLIRLENKLKCADLFENCARSLSGGD